jgi:phage N-6-adenine-methyltransferase
MSQKQYLDNMNVRAKQDWETPVSLFNKWTEKLALTPILDTCATDETSKCERYYTVEDDALTKQWHTPWFMNPPYESVEKWVEYAWKQFIKFKQDGMIVVFNKTDVKWFHKIVYDVDKLKLRKNVELYFEKGRIKFLEDGIPSKHPSPHGIMIIVFSMTSLKERRKRCGR